MTESIGELASGVFSAGGGVALAFIVLLALGIATMMAVYLISSVVVLDRFARSARRSAPKAVAGAGVAAVAALLAMRVLHPELASAPRATWAGGFAPVLLGAAVATAAAMTAVSVAMRSLDPVRLASLGGRALGLGMALAAAGTGLGLLPVGLAGVPGLYWCASRLRRRGRGGSADEGEQLAARITLLFLVASALVLLPASLVATVGAVGGWLLVAIGGTVVLGLLPQAIAGFVDMRGTAEWFIAGRYLVARRRQIFISAITGICVVGIAAGVWLIIVVLSVMNGFEQTWRDEILGDRAHFVIERGDGPIPDWAGVLERVRATPGVVAASPYLDADAMVRGRGGEIYSVRVRGVDPEAASAVTRLRENVVAGSLEDLSGESAPTDGSPAEEDEARLPGIVIGNQLSASLGLGLGDRLLVISPFGGPPTPLGPGPRISRFRIVGLSRAGAYQYDEVYVYVSIPAAQEFRRSGPVIDGIEAVTTDYYRSQAVGEAVVAGLGKPFRARDWKEYFPAFFQALKTERVMMGVLLTMIMVVAAFIIVATLVMMIMEKSSDIAILKAMGAENALVERIFALEGTMIGLLGTVLGVLAGLAVTHRLRWIQDRIEGLTGVDTLPSSVYQLSSLPSRVDPVQVAVVVTLAMVLSLGATLLPSWQGARIDPAEGLRHE